MYETRYSIEMPIGGPNHNSWIVVGSRATREEAWAEVEEIRAKYGQHMADLGSEFQRRISEA